MIKKYLKEYKENFKECINDLKHKETFYKQIPNLITILRPLGMIPANILFFTGNTIPAVILMGALLSTDFIDGKLARKWHVQSKFGSDLDAIGDKITFFGLSLPIVASNPIILLNIILELAIAAVNISGKLKGLDIQTVYSGKIKTWILSLNILTGYLVQIYGIPSFTLNSLAAMTCLAQGITLVEYIKKNKAMKQNQVSSTDLKEEIIIENNQEEDLIEKLKKEKEFLISTQEPNIRQKDKTKTRKKNK